MMRIIGGVIAIFLAVCPEIAHADSMIYYKACQAALSDKASAISGLCMGYVGAYSDMLAYYSIKTCIPEQASNAQISMIWVKYMKEHPEELNKPAIITLDKAISKAFPCKD